MIKCKHFLTSLFFILSGWIIWAEQSPAIELWKKAVLFVNENKGWIPLNTSMEIEDMDNKGKVLSLETAEYKMDASDPANIKSILVKYEKDGADITAKKAKEQEQALKSGNNRSMNANFTLDKSTPFFMESQANVTYSSTGETQVVNEQLCILFSFENKMDKKQTQKGKAWLDASTGVPRRITYSTIPLPMFVQEYSITIDFYTSGLFSAQKMIMEGKGTFLFLQKNMRFTMLFGNFKKL